MNCLSKTWHVFTLLLHLLLFLWYCLLVFCVQGGYKIYVLNCFFNIIHFSFTLHPSAVIFEPSFLIKINMNCTRLNDACISACMLYRCRMPDLNFLLCKAWRAFRIKLAVRFFISSGLICGYISMTICGWYRFWLWTEILESWFDYDKVPRLIHFRRDNVFWHKLI